MEFTDATFPARTYLVKRQAIKMQDIANPEMWQTAFEKVHTYIQQSDLEIAGPASAVYFAMDPETGTTDFGIGHPVAGATEITDPDLELAVVGESKALLTVVKGNYMQFGQAHMKMWQHCDKNGLNRHMPVIEEYMVDGQTTPDESQWESNLYCLHG